MTEVIRVTGLNKSFGGVPILKDLDITVNRRDVVAILGPSGSGKTTLLRCLNFLETSDSGLLTFDAETYDLNSIRKHDIARIRRKTAFVFQSYNLFANKNVLDNVTLGLTVARRMPGEKAERLGMDLLDRVGMADFSDRYPIQLSGGQQQRVAIARAMAGDPEIIYFDEPTSALDPELIGEVLLVMKQLAQDGMTMMIVTHELNFAKNVSNKCIFMEDGTIVEQGLSADLFNEADHERTRQFLQAMDHRHDV